MNIMCEKKEPEEIISSKDDNTSETSNITDEDEKILNIKSILNKITIGDEEDNEIKLMDEETIIKLIDEENIRNKLMDKNIIIKLIEKQESRNRLFDVDNTKIKLMNEKDSGIKLINEDAGIELINKENIEIKLMDEENTGIKLMDEENTEIKLMDKNNTGIKLMDKNNTEIKFIDLNELYLEDEIIDPDKQFSIGYSKDLNTYFMKITLWWVSLYDRWYKITKEDFILYKKDRDAFYKKFDIELKQNSQCFTYNLVGSGTLRDYDCVLNFHNLKPSKKGNDPFIGHALIDDIFYAVIEWEDETILIPPIQIIDNKYPLRDKCKPYEIDGKLVCYAKVF